MGFAFFCLIASFGGQKLEILDCYHTGQHFLFRGSLNFALFHFSCKAHKKICLGSEKKWWIFFTDKLMVSHRRFPPNRPFVKIPTDHWCFIAQFSPIPDPWCLGFIMGTRSKTTRSFRWVLEFPPTTTVVVSIQESIWLSKMFTESFKYARLFLKNCIVNSNAWHEVS